MIVGLNVANFHFILLNLGLISRNLRGCTSDITSSHFFHLSKVWDKLHHGSGTFMGIFVAFRNKICFCHDVWSKYSLLFTHRLPRNVKEIPRTSVPSID